MYFTTFICCCFSVYKQNLFTRTNMQATAITKNRMYKLRKLKTTAGGRKKKQKFINFISVLYKNQPHLSKIKTFMLDIKIVYVLNSRCCWYCGCSTLIVIRQHMIDITLGCLLLHTSGCQPSFMQQFISVLFFMIIVIVRAVL